MRQVIRSVLRARGFAVIAVLTLAVGIGVNTAVFSVVNGVLLRPLPYPNAERIVQIWRVSNEDASSAHNAPDYLDFQRTTRTLALMAGYREDAFNVAAPGADPVRVTGAQVTTGFFDVFGMPPAQGRTFSQAAGDGAGEPRAVLAESVWRDVLAADPAVVGRSVRINGISHTIVGVMPAAFDYPLRARVWVVSPKVVPLPPMTLEGDLLQMRDVSYFSVVGLLTRGASVEEAGTEFVRMARDLSTRYPRVDSNRSARVALLRDQIVGNVRQGLFLLLGAVAVVLLIACANVASLLLARGSGRQRELAVRAALGASRGRLVGHLLAESLVLGAAGGALGLLFAAWTTGLLVSIMPAGLPRVDEIGLDARVVVVCMLTSLASAALFGLIPSLQVSRTDASSVLRQGGDRLSTAGRRRAHTRSALVVAEIALTLVLLVTAALLGNSFLRLQRTDPGFAADALVVVQMPLPQGKYTTGDAQSLFYERLLAGLEARGEIQMAAVTFPRPFGGGSASGSFFIEGRAVQTPADQPNALIATISPEYFRVMGIPLIAGRHLTDRDRKPAPAAIVVNTAFVRRYFPGVNPVGKRIRFDEDSDEWLTIVGVAADTRMSGLATEPAPTMYLAYQYFTLPFLSVVARSAGGPAAVASAVRSVTKEIDPELPIDSVRPVRELVQESVAEPRFRTWLLGGFAATALILSVIGVYGLVSYTVAQRTREIGIRVALGARPSQVVRPILREGMTLAVAGVALGLAGSLAAARVIGSFLFGVEPTDPLTFASVSLLMLIVTLLASYVPSRRALRVDPLEALRTE